jgi:hypothetical protein
MHGKSKSNLSERYKGMHASLVFVKLATVLDTCQLQHTWAAKQWLNKLTCHPHHDKTEKSQHRLFLILKT